MQNLEKLFFLRGVAAEYYDYSGNRILIPGEDRLRLLQAMGQDVSSREAVEQTIFDLDAKPWTRWLQPLQILRLEEGPHFIVRVHPDELDTAIDWSLVTEGGCQMSGRLIPAELPETGEYFIGHTRYSARRLDIGPVDPGYHDLTLWRDQRRERAQLLAAPPRCYGGDNAPGQARLWGINCQLYTLRSPRNWGIGDFSDLRELVELAAAAGAGIIGLNPLHAPHMTGADYASPYSPSDRRFLNPLYIDPEDTMEFGACTAVRDWVGSAEFQRRLAALRDLPLVDYDGVTALKYPVFRELYEYFRRHHLGRDTGPGRSFADFSGRLGQDLVEFAKFESEQTGLPYEGLRDPDFHCYLQWLADGQLRKCQQLALHRGMKIGLMRDLAIGAVAGGAEVAANPDLFRTDATIGAPPDPFSDSGQDWNLPPLDPTALRAANYRHFIRLLRSNMAHAGALRIDHVMGLMRLWWCLPGMSSGHGAYVYFSLEDMLAIVRLESHRNRCLVVGEDMGVVPRELRQRMGETALYSNKLFYFERRHDGSFRMPAEQQEDALLMVTNHDVPTLAGWWRGRDIELRRELLPEEKRDFQMQQAERREDKICLLDWLQNLDLLPAGWQARNPDQDFDLALCDAILQGCARSRSELMLCQLEDLQLLEDPVNIPGTYREYPNWRRKQLRATGELLADPAVAAILAAVAESRGEKHVA